MSGSQNYPASRQQKLRPCSDAGLTQGKKMFTPSLAESHYRGLLAKGEGLFAFLDSLGAAASPSFETEWLDFKGAAKITETEITKYWSKALAGFGTTQGGVLIWGLDCRKNGTPPIDCVTGPSYVQNPLAFKSRLLELHHVMTDPPIRGIEIEAVVDKNNSGQGFVLCFIPESSIKPIRAESSGKQFYIRVGDDFVHPPVALLRSLFAPGSSANLAVKVRTAHWPEEMDQRVATYIDFWIDLTNRGLISVNGLYVGLTNTDRYYPGGDFSTPSIWTQRSTSNWPSAFEAQRAVHPGETTSIFKFRSGILLKERGATNYALPAGYKQIFDLSVFANNHPGFRAKMTINEQDVYHRVSRDFEILPLEI